jgi:uncharacterized protein
MEQVRWKRVDNPDVIDARGGGSRVGGARVAVPGGLGLVGVLIYLAIAVLGGGGSGGTGFDVPGAFDTGTRAPQSAPIPADQDPDRDLKDFSTYVFTDTQRLWRTVFERDGHGYRRAKMVLYSGGVDTGCGGASSAVGPFYCPADQRVYLDLSFERELSSRLKAGGDFAWAYVIAHEMGHHVQHELGLETADRSNAASVRIELQADCYAGVWAQTVFKAGDLEQGDIEEAFNAAEAVGDDRLQREATGTVNPDTFTHGTSAQRRRSFTTGYDAGTPDACMR